MNIVADAKHDSVGNDDGSFGGEDFVLTGGSAWLRVDKYSLLITNDEDNSQIRVKAFPLGDEMSNPIKQLYIDTD